jgi:hypothetical protein
MHYNNLVLNGWVKQPSPCCGAASVAGALNCLLRLSRRDANAFTHIDILAVYRRMFTKQITNKISLFEKKLGHSFDSILRLLEIELAKDGRLVCRHTILPTQDLRL